MIRRCWLLLMPAFSLGLWGVNRVTGVTGISKENTGQYRLHQVYGAAYIGFVMVIASGSWCWLYRLYGTGYITLVVLLVSV